MVRDYFGGMLSSLASRARLGTVSLLGFANVPLRRHLMEVFSRPYGEEGSFLADPAFEAVFGWTPSSSTMNDLAGRVLAPALVDAMDRVPRQFADEYRFPRDRAPYVHQVEAWKALRQDPPTSVIVTSGTGSGKTECFMVPILDQLVREREAIGSALVGVRALFLYPLNALINSQRERLLAWTDAFGDGIRFCLYNGLTPDRVPAHEARNVPAEVADRRTLRSKPPPILVTNSTMLEYMLVRTDDAPILEVSKGKLRWIVLDEAHTYIGSQAAEISLLIRRVLHAFGVNSDQVRFVATSATIGDPQGDAGRQLRSFLAQLAGVDESRVHLVAGRRAIPQITAAVEPSEPSVDDMWALDQDAEGATPARYRALCVSGTARRVRDLFVRSPERPIARLSDVCSVLAGAQGAGASAQQTSALRWLDLLSSATDTDGTPFLPLRTHLFHQTMSGLWACADPACPEKSGSALDDSAWPYGDVYLAPRQHCTCGAPAYEVVACDDCGTIYLQAQERGGRILQSRGEAALDEFELDVETESDDSGDSGEAGDTSFAAAPAGGHELLIVNRPYEGTGDFWIGRADRRVAEADRDDVLRVRVAEDGGEGLGCPACGSNAQSARILFRHARVGAPFLLGGILPTLLEFAADGPSPADRPYRGRRLLTFSDSRQGTARLAARLQQDAERTKARGLVYHYALDWRNSRQGAGLEALRKDVADLEGILTRVTDAAARRPLEELIRTKRVALAEEEQPTPIPFPELQRRIAQEESDFPLMLRTYRHFSRSTFDGGAGALALSGVLLVREFGRRPRRLNSLETMGLVSVQYPKLSAASAVPSSWAARGLGVDAWRSLLKIALDYFVRGGGSLNIPNDWRDWLGVRFGRSSLVPANHEVVDRTQRRWSQARRAGTQSLLVRLLASVLQVDPESDVGQDKIDEVLVLAWEQLRQLGVLSPTANGFTLRLEELAFAPMDHAWVCPVTRRFLDVTLQGITPYLPRDSQGPTVSCTRVDLPVYDQAFGGEADPMKRIQRAREWLARQAGLQQLREEGLWSDFNDRVIELAPYFTAAEHSAQQPAASLARYEKDFKEGRLNLLSCSTTMEMGIDIGGVQLVAMNNVPPHPANYLQRAGRAGRRRETRSASMTLCKSNPHDQGVFANSRWAFEALLPAPVVSLSSPVIVQRHVNAMVLSHFLRKLFGANAQDLSRLSCGWFFVAEANAPVRRYSDWCAGFEAANEPELADGLSGLVRHSVFEGQDVARMVRRAGDEMSAVHDRWQPEWKALCDQETAAAAGLPNDPAVKAIAFQKRRMSDEYLLRELATQTFLPGYGFPTSIASFDNMTVSAAKRLQAAPAGGAAGAGRVDNRFQRRELASRDLVTALREYAPGSDVVMDGLVYRSAGVTLNWHVPASQQEVREAQAIRYAWRCRSCGASGVSNSLDIARRCDACGANNRPTDIREFLEPAGFSVDFYKDPHNDVASQQFVPVEAPWISARGDWTPLSNPGLGRFRASSMGNVYHHSAGAYGQGYALCLACGRAEPMSADGQMPSVFSDGHTHNKLRSRADDRVCAGSHNPWVIKRGISLGHQVRTDVLEIQLKDTAGVWLNDRVAALTIAVALRDSLAALLGVQPNELGCDVQEARADLRRTCQSIFIFDRHAAGYASGAERLVDQMLRSAHDRLNCPKGCDSCCPHCVLDFDQRFEAESLDRHVGLRVLSDDWLRQLRLPNELRAFGDASRIESAGIVAAVLRESGNAEAELTRLFVRGEGEQLDIAASSARTLVYRLTALLRPVELLLDRATLSGMGEADRHTLASLAEHPHTIVSVVESLPTAAGGMALLAEVQIGEQAVRWATPDGAAQAFGPAWGQTEEPIVAGSGLPSIALAAAPLRASDTRPKPFDGGDREIVVHHDLDGNAQGFGLRLWAKVCGEHPPSAGLLKAGADAVTAVRYSDRYLFTPLAVALLVEVVAGLREVVGKACWNELLVQVFTTELRPAGLNRSFGKVYSDWQDSGDRDGALREAFAYVGLRAQVNAGAAFDVRHGRSLEVDFESGCRLTVRFDQGVSYWRVSQGGAVGRKVPVWFDFGGRGGGRGGSAGATAAELKEQGRRIAEMRVPVEGGQLPTELFVKLRGTERN